MSLAKALDQLSKARQYVVEGEQCMSEHRKVLDMLERQGYDALDAILFLEYLEEMQDKYVAHQDCLERRVMAMVKP
jgi:hypothetical protein